MGRTAPSGKAPGKGNAESAATSAPVVTLEGVCRERQPQGACKTEITREDLDAFVNDFAPGEKEGARARLAVQYARTLAFSAFAEQLGLEKDPALAKELAFEIKMVRMRLLATAFLRNLQKQSPAMAETETEKYYEIHKDEYEQILVRRLAVPFEVPTETGRPLERSAVRAEMEALRNRALAGEDFSRLQADAYKDLHIQAAPPPVNVVTVRRDSFQGEEAKALDQKPGEISPVVDTAAALVVIKVESKGVLPLESVRAQVMAALYRDRLQTEVSALAKRVKSQFDLQYLEIPAQPDIFDATALSPAVPGRSTRPETGRRPRTASLPSRARVAGGGTAPASNAGTGNEIPR